MNLENKIKISLIILAAGYSSRMGDFKPLLKIKNRTALEHIVDSFNKADVKDIIVVIGHNAQEIKNVYQGPEIKFVYNKFYDEGMYSSVIEGVKNLAKENDGFFILPVDIPSINQITIEEIKKAFTNSGKGIIYPNFNGVRGHPPLISTKYINKIINHDEKGGLKNLLDNYESDSWDIEVVDQGILLDMDTPEDYKNLLNYNKNYNIPNMEECKAILAKYCISEKIIKHCEKVREVALKISKKLINKGCSFNLRLIESSALLHDIKKGQPQHAVKGAELLYKLNYPNVAEIIRSHMDIIVEERGITEKEIIYLSDKMVVEDRIVSLDERFQRSLNKFKANKEISKSIERRMKNAKRIQEKLGKYGEYNYAE